MKKVIALLLALVMVVGLIACGAKEEPEVVVPNASEPAKEDTAPHDVVAEPVTITWAISLTDNYTIDVYNDVVAAFETEHPEIQVELVEMPANDRSTWLKTQLSAGNLPDVNMFVTELAKAGALLEVPEDMLSYYNPGALSTLGGGNYMVPWNTQYRFQVYYNKAMFADAGVEIPTTWDEYVEVCKALSAKGYTPMISAGNADSWCQLYGYWLCCTNGEMVAEDAQILENLKSGATKWTDYKSLTNSLNAIKAIYDAGYYHPGSTSYSYAQASEEFDGGAAAMMLDGSWRAAGYDGAGTTDFGCFVLPNISGVKNYCTVPQYMGVSAETKNPEACWTFIKYLTVDNQELYKSFLSRDGVFPTTIDAPTMDLGPMMTTFVANYEGYEMVPELVEGVSEAAVPDGFYNSLMSGLTQIFAGSTGEEVADFLQQEMEMLMG